MSSQTQKKKLKAWQIVLIVIGALFVIGLISNAANGDEKTAQLQTTTTITEAVTEKTNTEPVAAPTTEALTEAPTEIPTEPPTEEPTESPTNPPVEAAFDNYESEDTSQQVYYTETGSKYHYENPCGRGTYYATTLNKALSMGLEPCNKCVLH